MRAPAWLVVSLMLGPAPIHWRWYGFKDWRYWDEYVLGG